VEKVKIRSFLIATVFSFLCLTIFFTGFSRAEYPENRVALFAVTEPGGAPDLLARTVALGTEKALGARVIVENRPGGAGTLGMAVLANAKPDGYTLCAAPSDAITHVPLMLKVPYQPLKSFTPVIGLAAALNTALIVNKDATWKTFKEFIDYAKKNPGKIKYSTSGVGLPMHAAMEYIAKKDGIKWTHIPYKSSTQARMALMGGHVDACSSGSEFGPSARDGQVIVLAMHGEKRSPHFPNVPTLKELGYDFTKEMVHCIFGPANLPSDVLQKLETAFTKGTETPEFKSLLEKIEATPVSYKSKALDSYLKDTAIKAEKMYKDIGIIKEPATPIH
jgi:tripartite-type tricarboxylate transporter receptor subunit TctC